MPTPEQALLALLQADPTTTLLCTGGIWCDQAPQQDVNYLLFQVVSDVSPILLSGASMGIRFVRFQLTARFDKRENAAAFKLQMLALLGGKVNQILGALAVKSSRIIEDEGATDEDESPRPGEESGYRVVRLDLMWSI
jgi:hypothetical protein